MEYPIQQRIEAEIPRLKRYARALTRNVATADDLIQDCLMRALSKAHLWQEGTDLRAWLFTMMHNLYINSVRKAVREGWNVPAEVLLNLGSHNQTDSSLGLRALERALAKLSEEHRQVILLIALEGLTYEEVAEILSIPLGTVRSRLHRGRFALRDHLEGIYDGEKLCEPMHISEDHHQSAVSARRVAVCDMSRRREAAKGFAPKRKHTNAL